MLVWIHGGGLTNGGSASRIFDGAPFARDGIVTVTLNYRLGRFGFFAHPALTAEAGAPTGNFGFLDQMAALRWVRTNITRFGGDPRNVTLVGESAGGISILTLMGSPAAKGLFARAVVMSGGGRDLLPAKPLGAAEATGIIFARNAGITARDSASLATLRALPAAVVAKGVVMSIGKAPGDDSYVGGSIIDGTTIVASTEQIFREGRQLKVPIIVGATADDAPIGARPGDNDTLFATLGQDEAAARTAYDPDGTRDADTLRRAMARDRAFIEPARFIAGAASRAGQPTWLYRFSYVAQGLPPSTGARHASDVPYLFATTDLRYGSATTDRDRQLAAAFHTYVERFVRAGDPNSADMPVWTKFQSAPERLLDFANNGMPQMVLDPITTRLDVTERHIHSIDGF